MPVQDVRFPNVSARSERDERRESSEMTAAGPRPAAVDAMRWGATLLTQLGLEPPAGKRHHPAA